MHFQRLRRHHGEVRALGLGEELFQRMAGEMARGGSGDVVSDRGRGGRDGGGASAEGAPHHAGCGIELHVGGAAGAGIVFVRGFASSHVASNFSRGEPLVAMTVREEFVQGAVR